MRTSRSKGRLCSKSSVNSGDVIGSNIETVTVSTVSTGSAGLDSALLGDEKRIGVAARLHHGRQSACAPG
jgi:hypothetical protein